jgi:hypothetical protein
MKHHITIALIFFLLLMQAPVALSQNVRVEFDTDFDLKNKIPMRSVTTPKYLPIWTPPPPEKPYDPKKKPDPPDPPVPPDPPKPHDKKHGGSGMGLALAGVGVSVPLLVGGGVLALCLSRKKPPYLPPNPGSLNPKMTDPISYQFDFGEEILYSLVFKDSEKTPIHPDTLVYIQIPAWLEYQPETTYINNYKLTDKADDDHLIYFKDDNMLVLSMNGIDTAEGIVINFTSKVLTSSVSKKEAFCHVKFQSITNNFETKWLQLSVDDENQLPSSLVNVLNSK